MTRDERLKLNTLSKLVFGTSSKWLKLNRNQPLEEVVKQMEQTLEKRLAKEKLDKEKESKSDIK